MDNIDDFTANLEECLKDSVFEDTICKKPKRLTKNPSKKRQRKTKEQMKILEKFYEDNDDWSNELVDEIATKTNLKSKQVSKWFWDQKTKKKPAQSRPKKATKTHKRVKTMEHEKLEDFSSVKKPVTENSQSSQNHHEMKNVQNQQNSQNPQNSQIEQNRPNPQKPKLTIKKTSLVKQKPKPFKIQAPCFAPEQPGATDAKKIQINHSNFFCNKIKSPSFPVPKEVAPKENEINYFRPEFKKQQNLKIGMFGIIIKTL